MRRNLWLGNLLVLGLLAFTSATQATTIPIRGGSGYGPQAAFMACVDGTPLPAGLPCEAFSPTSIGTFTFGGSSPIDIVRFVSGSQGSKGTTYYIFDLGPIAQGTTFFLSAINSPLFNSSTAEIFSCGQQFEPLSNPQTFVTASGSTSSLGVPCVPNLTTNPLTPNTDGSFTVNQAVSDFVFDVPAATTSTPEPASLALLGFGLAAIGSKLRRKAA